MRSFAPAATREADEATDVATLTKASAAGDAAHLAGRMALTCLVFMYVDEGGVGGERERERGRDKGGLRWWGGGVTRDRRGETAGRGSGGREG